MKKSKLSGEGKPQSIVALTIGSLTTTTNTFLLFSTNNGQMVIYKSQERFDLNIVARRIPRAVPRRRVISIVSIKTALTQRQVFHCIRNCVPNPSIHSVNLPRRVRTRTLRSVSIRRLLCTMRSLILDRSLNIMFPIRLITAFYFSSLIGFPFPSRRRKYLIK